MMMMVAGIPSMCVRTDAVTFRWRKYETDRPNPHPGQYSNPRKWSGQMENTPDRSGLIIARKINENDQMKISK
jgi:hypothetical protein